MKKIFLLIAIAAFSFASAQNNDNPTYWVKPIKPKPKTNSFQLPKTFSIISTQTPVLIDSSRLLLTLANGNKVYALPQDNMPCIVPDMSQYNSVAVIKPDMPQYNIPNPAYPPQNKFSPLSPENLKELQELLHKRSKNTN